MIRFFVLGFVAIGVTLAGSFAGHRLNSPSAGAQKQGPETDIELVALDPITVPVVRQGKVQGYVMVRAALGASAADLKRGKSALMIYAGEAVFQSVYEDDAFDFSAMKPTQIKVLSERIVSLANARIGRQALKVITIESLNMLAHNETRDAKRRVIAP